MIKVNLNDKNYIISEEKAKEIIESFYKMMNTDYDNTSRKLDLNLLKDYIEDNCVNFVE